MSLQDKIAALPEWPPVPFDDADAKRFAHDPPCFLCGYNGPNYFQPSTHKCAERWHSHTYYDDEVKTAALARLALVRDMAKQGDIRLARHADGCCWSNILTRLTCSCGRDALLAALEPPK